MNIGSLPFCAQSLLIACCPCYCNSRSECIWFSLAGGPSVTCAKLIVIDTLSSISEQLIANVVLLTESDRQDGQIWSPRSY